MKIGIPKGLLSFKYNVFFNTFFKELGVEVINSTDTNKSILNKGTKYCVDDACLPIKIFHGHVDSIKNQCDLMLIPRIMEIKNKHICPKFCGLPEMIENSIPDMPKCITYPLYLNSYKTLNRWSIKAGLCITKNLFKIQKAFKIAYEAQNNFSTGINTLGKSKLNIALLGHPYNVYDTYVNMNISKVLDKFNIGIATEEVVNRKDISIECNSLFKKPFWIFAQNSYGAAVNLARNKKVDGIIYVSSFACGIDSIVIELIKNKLTNFPILILKIDEQTGEAGFHTRIEAFVDMLERRCG
ncbi:acyl-CoA dehydratase activase-related protein [Clostridium oceanicum]|uniref:Acyl-CoA dehydratase activase-related protein n=1 Tax=Clostridium oceanicum TaxID=1543 RepID=A0ABP3V7I1_9CLOT